MTICHNCGEVIEFRHVGGQLIPIHINGNYCIRKTGVSVSGSVWSIKHFRTFEAYINPNAECPVCKKKVFFYQSSFGGRVFFDDLGWPWPKHPCTDRQSAHSEPIAKPKGMQSGPITFRDKSGQSLNIYEFQHSSKQGNGWLLKFQRIGNGTVFKVFLSDKTMHQTNLEIEDFRCAPSFVVAPTVRESTTRLIHFICERLEKIITIELPKST